MPSAIQPIRGERDDAQPNHRYRNNHGQVVGRCSGNECGHTVGHSKCRQCPSRRGLRSKQSYCVGTDANRLAMMAALGSHHANKLAPLLPTQILGTPGSGQRSTTGFHTLLDWRTRDGEPHTSKTHSTEPGSGFIAARYCALTIVRRRRRTIYRHRLGRPVSSTSDT